VIRVNLEGSMTRAVAVCSLGRILPFLLVVAVLASACGGSGSGDDASAADEDAQANAARELFAAKGCAECHGEDGEGTDTPRTSLAGTRMIIQQFQTRVRNGRGSAMPAHTPEQITDEEIQTLFDWLRQ
jgi:mono/diheme cytochrome c family protein